MYIFDYGYARIALGVKQLLQIHSGYCGEPLVPQNRQYVLVECRLISALCRFLYIRLFVDVIPLYGVWAEKRVLLRGAPGDELLFDRLLRGLKLLLCAPGYIFYHAAAVHILADGYFSPIPPVALPCHLQKPPVMLKSEAEKHPPLIPL